MILTMQGNVVFSNELARRYGDQGIISISLNPGNINSELWERHTPRAVIAMVVRAVFFFVNDSLALLIIV